MENKKYFKKLLRDYLELKKLDMNSNSNDINLHIYLEKIYKIMDYISKLSKDNVFLGLNEESLETSIIESLDSNAFNFDCDIEKIVSYIKKYCYNKVSSIFDENLTVEERKISNNIFLPIEEGDLDAISISETCNNFRIYNDDGSTPLHVCIKNGDTTILKKFLKSGESIDLNDKNGHSLLEYACELKDPNLISFLISHGSNPKKHLLFRENNRDCKMLTNDIDIANILKICLQIGALTSTKELEYNDKAKLYNNPNNGIDLQKKSLYSIRLKELCYNKIENDYLVGLGNLEFKDFFQFLNNTIVNLSEDDIETYFSIISEEFNYNLKNKLGCPCNYFEILIISLFPFIKYDFNISTKFIIINELIYTVRNIFEKNNLKLNKKYYNSLLNKLWEDYRDVAPFDFIGINLSCIFMKIKNIL